MTKNNIVDLKDKNKLTYISGLLLDNREEIITVWSDSEKITALLEETQLSLLDFKNIYAYNIFDSLHTCTTNIDDDSNCNTILKLLETYKDTEDIIQLMTMACTEFKNIILKFIINSELEISLKLDIFSILSSIFDLNLISIISEHSTYLQLLLKNNLSTLEVFENSAVVSKTDAQGVITFSSTAYSKLIGYKKSELIGKTHALLRHPEVNSRVYTQMWNRLKKGKEWQGKLMNYTKYKDLLILHVKIIPTFDFNHKIIGYTAIRTDVTDSIHARTDVLTGIMNRLDFNKQLKLLSLSTTVFSLVMIDIDFFKAVNDNHGHIIGDEVLKQFTTIISNAIRPTDVFARWGGEEFVLILKDGNFNSHLETVERLRLLVDSFDFRSVGHKTASFGIVEYSNEYHKVLDFVDAVDKCLYHAKNTGRNCIAFVEDIGTTPILFK